jgi:hypothetical protein
LEVPRTIIEIAYPQRPRPNRGQLRSLQKLHKEAAIKAACRHTMNGKD